MNKSALALLAMVVAASFAGAAHADPAAFSAKPPSKSGPGVVFANPCAIYEQTGKPFWCGSVTHEFNPATGVFDLGEKKQKGSSVEERQAAYDETSERLAREQKDLQDFLASGIKDDGKAYRLRSYIKGTSDELTWRAGLLSDAKGGVSTSNTCTSCPNYNTDRLNEQYIDVEMKRAYMWAEREMKARGN